MSFEPRYKSNGAKIGTGTRITDITQDETGAYQFWVMVDSKTARMAEIEFMALADTPDPVPSPEPTPDPDAFTMGTVTFDDKGLHIPNISHTADVYVIITDDPTAMKPLDIYDAWQNGTALLANATGAHPSHPVSFPFDITDLTQPLLWAHMTARRSNTNQFTPDQPIQIR